MSNEQLTDKDVMFHNSMELIDTSIENVHLGHDDASIHFEAPNLAAFAYLKEADPAAYQSQRMKLKKQVKITDLESLISESVKLDSKDNETQQDKYLKMIEKECELLRDASKTTYAEIQRKGHTEMYQMSSRGFSEWALSYIYSQTSKSLSDTALKSILSTLSGKARFEGKEVEVFLRVGNYRDGYIIDLGNDEWQAVFVSAKGWKVINKSPIKFWRTNTMQALPIPEIGKLKKLWRFINVDPKDRIFILVFIFECWRNDTVFPVLELIGEKGSAKSFTQEIIRSLIDPNQVALRAVPKSEENLFVSANQNWVASYNNVSHLNRNMQDALCTLSTGGGYSSRKLYSNAEESVIDVTRPCMLNGIGAVVTSQDLVDRTLSLELPKIEEHESGRDLKEEFDDGKAEIFGGLLTLFAKTLRQIPTAKEMPINDRMADFIVLGEALCLALGGKRSFAELYERKKTRAATHALESSPAILEIIDLVKTSPFEGTYSQLLDDLRDEYRPPHGLPKTAKGLSDLLRRHASALQLIGIKIIQHKERKSNGYHVTIFNELTTPRDWGDTNSEFDPAEFS